MSDIGLSELDSLWLWTAEYNAIQFWMLSVKPVVMWIRYAPFVSHSTVALQMTHCPCSDYGRTSTFHHVVPSITAVL